MIKSNNKEFDPKGTIKTFTISIIVAIFTICGIYSDKIYNNQNYLELESEISKLSTLTEIVESPNFESITIDDNGYKVTLAIGYSKVSGYFDSSYKYIGNMKKDYNPDDFNIILALILYTFIYFIFINITVTFICFLGSLFYKLFNFVTKKFQKVKE